MKILLVTTGGTIASIIDDGVIDVSPQGKLLVLKKYREIDSDTQFEVVSPVNILSENITADDYKIIAKTMLSIDYDKYDGVIVTHGSDTLAYTSAMLGLLLSDIEKPVCVVAADKSLQDEKSNGMDNFVCAVQIVKSRKSGVFVPYRNADMVTYVHYALELFESSVLSDDFYSVGGACGEYKDNVLRFYDKQYEAETLKDKNKIDLSFSKKIIQVCPYPLLDYSRIDIEGADAVIHRTYHAGSVCANENDNTSVFSLVSRCQKANIPFYICGLTKGKDNYSSMNMTLKSNVIVLFGMSPACAFMKIMLEG